MQNDEVLEDRALRAFGLKKHDMREVPGLGEWCINCAAHGWNKDLDSECPHPCCPGFNVPGKAVSCHRLPDRGNGEWASEANWAAIMAFREALGLD